MKAIQKVKVLVRDGKKESKESVGEPRAIADSVADELLQQAKEVDFKSIRGIKTIEIWEELKVEKPKKEKTK